MKTVFSLPKALWTEFHQNVAATAATCCRILSIMLHHATTCGSLCCSFIVCHASLTMTSFTTNVARCRWCSWWRGCAPLPITSITLWNTLMGFLIFFTSSSRSMTGFVWGELLHVTTGEEECACNDECFCYFVIFPPTPVPVHPPGLSFLSYNVLLREESERRWEKDDAEGRVCFDCNGTKEDVIVVTCKWFPRLAPEHTIWPSS